ncbi:MAG TPA: rhodanese-like domain-containing protein [Steroidobacteraceae bacterium]|nr:rhodanese-like domain-containing protein [Steroidobacteraceae bacterium]
MQEITPGALQARLAASDPPLVLDVREPWEQAIARLQGTLDIPMSEVPARLEELPKDREIVVMCRSGGRSARVAQYLEQQGYRAANLTGGILRWAQEVDPTLEAY